MSESIQIRQVLFGSPEQQDTIELRRAILRLPLGLDFTKEELESEGDQIHIAAFQEDKPVAVLLFKPAATEMGTVLKMRQVAVAAHLQGKGIGTKLIRFSEQWAGNAAYNKIELHARLSALDFYLNLGYHTEGPEFTEVGIPHRKMYKYL